MPEAPLPQRYAALACDYDGTLADEGRVGRDTVAALERLRRAGRRSLLVTGRELDDLIRIFDGVQLFDWVVAENGAVLYDVSARRVELLAAPPPDEFVRALARREVQPLSVGRVIVATTEPHERQVVDVIREQRLPLQVIRNKGAVMVLPAGVDKAAGMLQALARMGLAPREIAGIGDAENDRAFLEVCGFSAAVANALESVKARVDWVTPSAHGNGVIELIDRLIAHGEVRLKPDATTGTQD